MWTSHTGKLQPFQVQILENEPAGSLLDLLSYCTPKDVFYSLTEVRLNGAKDKLGILMDSDAIKAKWQAYAAEGLTSEKDRQYAAELRKL